MDETSVVHLPTAAKRKVCQPTSKAARQARKALREAQTIRFPHKSPGVRIAERRAAILIEVEHHPATILADAILKELDEETRLRVIGRLAEKRLSKAGRQAFEIASATMLNFGEQWDLLNALNEARENRVD